MGVGQGAPPDSITRAVEEVFARPAYQWATQPSLRRWVGDRTRDFMSWLAEFERTSPGLFKVFLAALVLLLIALLVHTGYVLWRILRGTPATDDTTRPAVPGSVNAAAYLSRADELALAGAWPDALGHRFLSLLLELDGRRVLRFHPSKTPAEYIAEARLEPSGREALADLVGRLYRHVFGAAPCDLETYRAFGDRAQAVARSARAH